jgi:hypothetical protein
VRGAFIIIIIIIIIIISTLLAQASQWAALLCP